MNKSLKVRQICFFFIALLPVAKFFMLPSLLSEVAQEDGWISAALSCALDLFTIAALFLTLKDTDCDFFTLTEKHFGKSFAKIVAALYFVFFLLKTLLPLCEVKDYVELTLYMTTPTVVTFCPVFAVIFYLCLKRLRVIGRIADGVLAVALIGYISLFALSETNADFSALLPIGGRGFPAIARGAYYSQTWFSDAAYFLFFTGEYVKSKKDGLKILLSVCVSSLIVLIFCAVFYGTFGSIAFRQRFALTEISKYASVISNVERFDYIAIFALLFTSVFALSLPFYFATELFTRVFPVKRWIAAIITCLPSAIMLIFFSEYFSGVENFIINYANAFFLFMGSVFPVAVCAVLKIKTKKEKKLEIRQG
ncbi:MAG: GerAB/ArcD/ProY family transporter [Clostridia bacterium]|nr:GerAB/ArcD/ProY family transporter [Clostridia bacterium]